MYLTASNLAYYLMSRGLATAESIVDGDFTVIEAGRRNRNFKVLRQNSPSLFVKQIKDGSPEIVATHRREAAFYEMVRSRPAFSVLAQLIPRLQDYNPLTHSLVVTLVPEAENLTEHHTRLKDFPERVGEMMGRALGIYHAQIGWILNEPTSLAIFPRQLPWIFMLDPQTLYPLTMMGQPGMELAGILQRQPDLIGYIHGVRNEWKLDALIHGDMKWDNCLIAQNAEGQAAFHVVDWELADVGDASWDIASMITSYLVYGLFTIPLHLQGEEALAAFRATQAGMQASLRAFWQNYAVVRGFPSVSVRSYLERCLRFCAARLVIAAFEAIFNLRQVTANTLTMLQMSRTIFQSPSNAARELFGLSGA
jgi:hypothetical protein